MAKIILKEKEEVVTKKCPYCGSSNLVIDEIRGEIKCMNCGRVLAEELIDFANETRKFEDSPQELSRVAAAQSYRLPDLGATTQIGTTIDYSTVPINLRSEFKRLKRIQFNLVSKSERNLKPALIEISRIASNLGLPPSIAEEAALLYRRAAERNLIRGRSMESVVAACVYIAARKNGFLITLNEVEEVTSMLGNNTSAKQRELSKTVRYIIKQLGVKTLPMSVAEYIQKIASKLEIPDEVVARAINLWNELKRKGYSGGKSPQGVAAALLYIAAEEMGINITQRNLALIADITEVTIRNRIREIQKRISSKK